MALAVTEIPGKWLVQEQRGLDSYPMPRILKWLLRKIYDYYGFAATIHDGTQYCNVQEVGVYDDEADARWEMSQRPKDLIASIKWVPHNCSNPAQTAKVGLYDSSQPEVGLLYRNRRLPFTAVPTRQLEQTHADVRRLRELLNRTESVH